MEGFIHLKMPLWARRVLTRLLAMCQSLSVSLFMAVAKRLLKTCYFILKFS